AWERTKDVLPEYNNHGHVLNRYWPRLTEELPDYQFHLVDDEHEILARARTITVRWDGSLDDLPRGSTVPLRGGSTKGVPTGEYWFPRGLALLTIDIDANRGSYWEPNVWMRHHL